MAAHEHELEPLIGNRAVTGSCLVGAALSRLRGGKQAQLRRECAFSPELIERLVPRGRGQPCAGSIRHAFPRPSFSRGGKGILHHVLGELHVAEESDHPGEHAAPFLAEHLLDQGDGSASSRISTQPPSRAAGMRAASSIAPSRSAASTR